MNRFLIHLYYYQQVVRASIVCSRYQQKFMRTIRNLNCLDKDEYGVNLNYIKPKNINIQHIVINICIIININEYY